MDKQNSKGTVIEGHGVIPPGRCLPSDVELKPGDKIIEGDIYFMFPRHLKLANVESWYSSQPLAWDRPKNRT